MTAPQPARAPWPLIAHAAAVGALAGGLAEGLPLLDEGWPAVLAATGAWVVALPALWLALLGLEAIARSHAARALRDERDGPAWGAALAVLAGLAALAAAFGAGHLADRALDVLRDQGLVDPILRVGLLGLAFGGGALALLILGPLARGLARLPRGLRRPLVALLAVVAPLVALGASVLPLMAGRPLAPLAAAAVASAVAVARRLLGHRLGGPVGRRGAAASLALVAAAAGGGLWAYAADEDARAAVSEGDGLAAIVGLVLEWATDRDGDGFPGALGGADCDDDDPSISPIAVDVPDNGIDEDCSGADRTGAEAESGLVPHHPRPPALRDRKPPVLLITVDTLRPDRLHLYGHHRATSPAIDALGAAGVVFERAYPSANSTRHSLPTLLAGRPIDLMRTDRHGTTIVFEPGNHMLFERLSAAGYATEAHLSRYFDLYLELGLGRGFDRVVTVPQGVKAPLSAPALTDNAIRAVGQMAYGGEPWALWVHYTEPHAPYEAHPGIDFGDTPIDRYDGEIRRVDREIGRLLDTLDAQGLLDGAVVALTSDHGEAFGEHGRTHHGQQLYEESIRVPLIIRAPGLAPRRVPDPVSLVDLAHTLANLAGLDPVPAEDATSLLGPMLGVPIERHPRPLYVDCIWHDDRPASRQLAVIDGPLKLIYDLRTGHGRLFDLDADPGERRAVHRTRPAEASRLRTLARERLARYQEATLADLMRQRVAEAPPPDLEGPPTPIAEGLLLHGARVERIGARVPYYDARVWLEAQGDRRPDYTLEFVWTDRTGRRVARRTLKPLSGRYPTHRWRPGEVVEVVMRARITRGRGPFSAQVRVKRGKAPAGEVHRLGRAGG